MTFGKLLKVIDEPNRVIFEFQDGTKQYDAWSSKNGEGKWGLKNIAILKVVNFYVVSCIDLFEYYSIVIFITARIPICTSRHNKN